MFLVYLVYQDKHRLL